MKKLLLALVTGSALTVLAPAFAEHHETSVAMSTSTTTIGELLDDPDAKAVFEKHLPQIVADDRIDMARTMTLSEVQSYAPDQITDEKLEAMDSDLAELAE